MVETVDLMGFEMWKLETDIRGITPLLMHNPELSMSGGQTKATRGKNILPPEEEAERGLYRNDAGELYIPVIALRNCILNGCSRGGYRVKRSSLKTLLSAGMIIEPEELILMRDGEPITSWEIDVRRAVVQRQGILRARPKIAVPWHTRATVYLDLSLFQAEESLDLFWELINFSGRFVGILDYRPEKSGIFGQFTATAVE